MPLISLFPTYPQAKKDASRFRALVLISVAAVCCAAFTPHMTRPSVASKLAEIYHPDACPPQWVPVLLASSSSHVDNPVPRFDEEDLPFEALSMERRMDEGAETDPDCGSEEDLAAVWACHLKCMNSHFDATTNTYKQPGHANCKKEECPTLCSPPPSPPLGPPPPLASPPSPSPLCADKMHQQCKIQRCEIYKTSKKQRCKKTCGLCKAAPSAPASASASDDR